MSGLCEWLDLYSLIYLEIALDHKIFSDNKEG